MQAQNFSSLFPVARLKELKVDFMRYDMDVFFPELTRHSLALHNDVIYVIAEHASGKNCQPAKQRLPPSRIHYPQKVIAAISHDYGHLPLCASNNPGIAVVRVYQINRAVRQTPVQF